MATQDNWRWCNKCNALAYAGQSSLGACPAGGSHDHAGSNDYVLNGDVPVGGNQQDNWDWCNKCQALAYAGHDSPGACAAGGSHDHAGSSNYVLNQNIPAGANQQDSWRWCRKCNVLAYAGGSSLGACAAGGSHDHAGSGNYVLSFAVSATPTGTFTFSLDSFRITDTRARHNDTDVASLTLLVRSSDGTGTPQTIQKSMGDVNNGTHNVGLSFPNVAVPPSGNVVLNYLIVNSGNKSQSDVDTTLENVGASLAQKGLVAGGTALGDLILPGVGGPALAALGGWLAGEIKSLLTADCDGPVAAEQVTMTYAELLQRASAGPTTTRQPGTNSADGCGGNSMYYVTWHVSYNP